MTTASIGEHGIIGNMRSAALVNVFGAIDFFCFPAFDSPSVFASLLDSERAGSFSIQPAGEPNKGRQIYLPETNVLTTRFISQNSILELCDWMPVGGEALPHCIMRLLTATQGDIEVELRCRPAFQYAGVEHTLELSGESAAFHAASTGLPSIRLLSSVGLRAEGRAAFASLRLISSLSARDAHRPRRHRERKGLSGTRHRPQDHPGGRGAILRRSADERRTRRRRGDDRP